MYIRVQIPGLYRQTLVDMPPSTWYQTDVGMFAGLFSEYAPIESSWKKLVSKF